MKNYLIDTKLFFITELSDGDKSPIGIYDVT